MTNPLIRGYQETNMRNQILLSLVAVFALCGCDNPEDFTHPENPKKPGQLAVTPGTTADSATGTVTPEQPEPPVDMTDVKIGEASLTGDFTSVNSSGSLETDITIGSPTKVTIECSKRSFDDIILEVKEGTLNISTKPNFSATYAKVKITAPTINNIATSGMALVKLVGASGPSLNVTTADSSTVDAYGAVDNINVTANGASCVRMKGLTAKTGNVTSNDKCAVEVKATDEMNASSNGTSVINVAGYPRKFRKSKADQSYINLQNER